MINQNPHAYQVRAKTYNVVDYHYDDTRPGKPLFLVIPGGILALIFVALEYLLAYLAFWDQSLAPAAALPWMLIIFPFFVGSVFVFSYGYETYNMPKALRLTAILVIISLAAVVIVAVLFVLAGSLKSSSSSSRSGSSGSRGGGRSLTRNLGPILRGGSNAALYTGQVLSNMGEPILANTVARRVAEQVPSQIAPPQPYICANCGRSYMPNETRFACPNCGTPTPADLFACLNCGTQYIPSQNNFRCPSCQTPTPADV